MKKRPWYVPSFDHLEDRTVPAGNVLGSVIGGTLYLYGDDEANHLTIVRNGSSGITVTSGTDATTVNGVEGPVDFSNVTRGITVKLYGGDDNLEMTSISLSREVAVLLGDGNDVLKLEDIHAPLHSTITGGNGDDQIAVIDSVFSRELDLFGQAGDDQVDIINTRLGKKTNINGGSGIDDFVGSGNTWGARSKLYLFQTKSSSSNPLASDDAATLNEGESSSIDLAANDYAFNHSLDLASITITTESTNGTVEVNGDGTVTYTHDGSETTSDTFQYTIADSNGNTSNTATVTLTIIAANNLPDAVDDTTTVAEGGTVSISVASNDSDADGTLDLTTVIVSQIPLHGTATANSDGTITYVHDGSENATDNFRYTIKDNSGFASEAATVSITITMGNDAPVAANDTATVGQGASFAIPVTSNDSDAEGTLDLTTLIVSTNPNHGTVTVNTDGTITYQHDGSDTITDSFTYTINDNEGVQSNIATVWINPQAPVASEDISLVNEGESAVIDVASNDTDVDGTLALDTVTITQQPAYGTLSIDEETGQVTYQHDGSETATSDTFTYTITDNQGQVSNQATVTIAINLLNDAPVAVNDSGSVANGGSVTLNLSDNDTDADGTLDLTSIEVSTPTYGTVTVNGDGTVTYQHNGTESSSDSFYYAIKDELGLISNTGTVQLTITSA